jgi:hypothetical protein
MMTDDRRITVDFITIPCVVVVKMAREPPELQVINYYIREGFYHTLQVRLQPCASAASLVTDCVVVALHRQHVTKR